MSTPARPAGQQNQTKSHDHGLDLWGLFARRKWLMLLTTLGGAGLGHIYFQHQSPVFESVGRMVVVHEGPTDIPGRVSDGGSGAEDNLSTQALLIRSPVVIKIAVEKGKLASLPTLQGTDPVRAVIGRLNVKPTELNANVLDLSCRGSKPQDCAAIVNATMAAYRDYLGASQQSVTAETINVITEAKDVLLKRIQEKETAYRQFRQASPLVWKGAERTNIHHTRLTEIETARAQLLVSRSELASLIQAVESAVRRGASREALLLMMERMKGAGSATAEEKSLQGDLVPLLLEEAVLLQDLGPEHPKVASVKKRIELTRRLYRLPDTESGRPEAGRNQPQDFVRIYLDSLRQQVLANEAREKELNNLFEKERESGRKLLDLEMQDENFRADIGRLQLLFEAVLKRLQELSLFKDRSGYKAQIISPAEDGWQVEPNQMRIMIMGCVVGVFAGFSLAYLIELSDKSFRTPEDISTELELPILGHVPRITVNRRAYLTSKCRLHNTLSAFYEPRSRTAESFRTIRAAMFLLTHNPGHKVIQVTSPGPNDGKSTLVANLAICIAQSGKKVLLIEADLRCPTVHELMGVDATNGTTNVLDGSMELDDAIQQTDAPNLSVLPCGYQPRNPAEMLSQQNFKDMLDVLSNKFDFILIDTPPLLAVSDACVVSTCVDGVLLTLRIRDKSRKNAVRAREMLGMFNANVLGVVVNCDDEVGAHTYSGGYHGKSNKMASYYFQGEDTTVSPTARALETANRESSVEDSESPA